MIEDVKWLKADDYINKNKDSCLCWFAKDGNVTRGFLDKDIGVSTFMSVNKHGKGEIINPDGVCDRFRSQKPPVLR